MDKNTPQAKGIRTAVQAIAGTVVAFVTGLLALPEVQTYVNEFVKNEGYTLVVTLLAMVGVSSGIIAFLQNKIGK